MRRAASYRKGKACGKRRALAEIDRVADNEDTLCLRKGGSLIGRPVVDDDDGAGYAM
jgi:hypothetical protein